MDKIEIALPVYDDEGNQVDTTTVFLDQEQIQDIVNCSARVVYADRIWGGGDDDTLPELMDSLAELDEALTSYSVIEELNDEVVENNS